MPSQLDEEEERRKRRREKNKVAAARCRNKKKERTEFLQRVSGVVGVGGVGRGTHVVLQSELVTKACGIEVDLLASVPPAATPQSFPASQPVPLPQHKITLGHWPQIPPSQIPGRPEKLGGAKSPL